MLHNIFIIRSDFSASSHLARLLWLFSVIKLPEILHFNKIAWSHGNYNCDCSSKFRVICTTQPITMRRKTEIYKLNINNHRHKRTFQLLFFVQSNGKHGFIRIVRFVHLTPLICAIQNNVKSIRVFFHLTYRLWYMTDKLNAMNSPNNYNYYYIVYSIYSASKLKSLTKITLYNITTWSVCGRQTRSTRILHFLLCLCLCTVPKHYGRNFVYGRQSISNW